MCAKPAVNIAMAQSLNKNLVFADEISASDATVFAVLTKKIKHAGNQYVSIK